MDALEELLIVTLRCTSGKNEAAALLQSYIATYGPLSDLAGKEVRLILSEKNETEKSDN